MEMRNCARDKTGELDSVDGHTAVQGGHGHMMRLVPILGKPFPALSYPEPDKIPHRPSLRIIPQILGLVFWA